MSIQSSHLRRLKGRRRRRMKWQSDTYVRLPESNGFTVSELKRNHYLPNSCAKPGKNKNGIWMIDLNFGTIENGYSKRMTLYEACSMYGARMINLLHSHMRSYAVDDWDTLRNDILAWRIETSSDEMPGVGDLVSFVDESDYTIFQKDYPLFEVIRVDSTVKEIYKWEKNQYKNVQIRHVDHTNTERLTSPNGYATGWVNHDQLEIECEFDSTISNEVRALRAANAGQRIVIEHAASKKANLLEETKDSIKRKIRRALGLGTHGSTQTIKIDMTPTLFEMMKDGWEKKDVKISIKNVNKIGTITTYAATAEEWKKFFGLLKKQYFDLNTWKIKAPVDVEFEYSKNKNDGQIAISWKCSDETYEPLPTGSPEY